VARVLSNVLSLDYISENDVFVSTSSDKFGVVLADIKSVNIVVMNVFVVFNHEVLGRIIEANASIL
jgi:hypothetical protein